MIGNPHGGRTIEREKEGKRGIDFSANLNPLGPPEGVRKRWRELFWYVSLYPPLDPFFVSRLLGRIYGFSWETLFPSNGATQSIYLLGRLLEGETVLIMEPCFSEYARAFLLGKKRVEHFSVLSGEDPLPMMRRADVVVVGNPTNPIGDVGGFHLYRRAREEGIKATFLVDEVFQEFLREETSLVHKVLEDRGLYIVRSLTKYYALAGLRGGFIVTHPNNVLRLLEHFEPWSVNAVLVGVLEILAGEDLLSFHEATKQWLCEEKAFLEESFASLSFLDFYPSRANFYTLRMREKNERFFSFLEERGIFVRRLYDFFGLDRRFFRVAVRTREENEKFLEVVREVGGA